MSGFFAFCGLFFLFSKTTLYAQNCSSTTGDRGPLNNLKSVYHIIDAYHVISKAFEVYAKNSSSSGKQTNFHVNRRDNELSLKFFSFLLVLAGLSMNSGTLMPPDKSKPVVDSMKLIVGKTTGKLLFKIWGSELFAT